MNSSSVELTFEPAPALWLARTTATPLRARAFREQMGLPQEGRLVLSGHQADLWHGGILAKHFASLAFAARNGARAAWIVVDQDEAGEIGMRIPVRDANGQLRESRWQWGGGAGRIVSAIAPIGVKDHLLKSGEIYATPSIAEGVRAAAAALALHAKETNWAMQVGAAAAQLIGRSAPPPRFVYESRLASTELFQQFVDAMVRGGTEFIRGYNEAVASTPASGMRLLDEARGELPVWDVRGGRRRRVLLADVAKLDRGQIAPRGMLMTAILRLAGCDLFVHGIGGGMYDQATQAWVAGWKGDLQRLAQDFGDGLAPMAVATANLRLPLAKPGLPTDEEIRRGVWMAHHAAHDPAALGDQRGAAEKARLVAEIRTKKARRENPALSFAALHAVLAASRRDGAGKLEQFVEEARRLTRQRAEVVLAFDRTWSFALQSPADIGAMYERTLGAFAGRG